MKLLGRRGILLTAALAAAGLSLSGARAASTSAAASVKIVKPLELTGKRDLAFGTIVLDNVTSPATVSLSPTGALVCGSGLVCSGTVLPAIYNVRGTNNMVARITGRASNLTNSVTGTTILFTPTVQASVTLTSSGAPGNDFNVGGSITITPATADGLYSGAIDITVEYN